MTPLPSIVIDRSAGTITITVYGVDAEPVVTVTPFGAGSPFTLEVKE